MYPRMFATWYSAGQTAPRACGTACFPLELMSLWLLNSLLPLGTQTGLVVPRATHLTAILPVALRPKAHGPAVPWEQLPVEGAAPPSGCPKVLVSANEAFLQQGKLSPQTEEALT